MGDRNVVGIRQPGAETLYLYSHWGGDEQEKTLAHALVRAMGRWDDDAYATRILVSQYIADDWDKETGYGLSVGWYPQPDYGYIYEINWTRRSVYRVPLDEKGSLMAHDEDYSFDEFIGKHLKGEAA